MAVRTLPGNTYAGAGVDTEGAEEALGQLLESVRKSFTIRPGIGHPVLNIGHYANVLDIGHNLGLAISTDGVGTKALVAQELGKYDTIGIDCVAMNVNDVICVGAEPIAMTDYIAVAKPDPAFFREIGLGLLKGCELSNINIPGGEVAQIGEMITGHAQGHAFDLVGTAVGLVPLDRMLTGEEVKPGDVIVGLASSGIHSNGLSLARKVARDLGMNLKDFVPELGRTLGEELLEPTAIYVRFAVDALSEGLTVKAFAHITSDGLLNLLRMPARVEYVIDELFERPIFALIQTWGQVDATEMFRVYNMGVGFCAVAAPDAARRLVDIAGQHGHEAKVIGSVAQSEERRVRIPSRGLVGEGRHFYHAQSRRRHA